MFGTVAHVTENSELNLLTLQIWLLGSFRVMESNKLSLPDIAHCIAMLKQNCHVKTERARLWKDSNDGGNSNYRARSEKPKGND